MLMTYFQVTSLLSIEFTYVGMLSKSKGQIVRVAATMHVLFNWETPHSTLFVISDEAMKVAIDFVEICNHHVNYLTIFDHQL